MKLGEYMKRYIFDVVSAKDATFHPELREDLQARKARNWEREGQTLKEQMKPVYAENTLDDFGGGGLFATVNDLLKIYQGILTEKLLRPETIKEMFQPHLENIGGLDKPEEYSLSTRNAIWNTVPNDVPVNFGIGGLINTAAVPKRRGVNSLTWSGHANCYWVGQFPMNMNSSLLSHSSGSTLTMVSPEYTFPSFYQPEMRRLSSS